MRRLSFPEDRLDLAEDRETPDCEPIIFADDLVAERAGIKRPCTPPRATWSKESKPRPPKPKRKPAPKRPARKSR